MSRLLASEPASNVWRISHEFLLMTWRFRSVEKLVCLRGNGNSFLVEDLQHRFIASRILNQWASNLVKCSSEWCDWQSHMPSRQYDQPRETNPPLPPLDRHSLTLACSYISIRPLSLCTTTSWEIDTSDLSKYWCNINALLLLLIAESWTRLRLLFVY